MITKTFSKTGKTCRVTFQFVPPLGVGAVSVCGDFNAWTPKEHALSARKDGSFALTLSLPLNQCFEFKYLLDNGEWHNDDGADAYPNNQWGQANSLVDTAALEVVPAPEKKPVAKKATKKAAKKAVKKATPKPAPKKAVAKKVAAKKVASKAPKKVAKKAVKKVAKKAAKKAVARKKAVKRKPAGKKK